MSVYVFLVKSHWPGGEYTLVVRFFFFFFFFKVWPHWQSAQFENPGLIETKVHAHKVHITDKYTEWLCNILSFFTFQ